MTTLQPQTNTFSHQQAMAMRDEVIWDRLKDHTVKEAATIWLKRLNHRTMLSYRCSLNVLNELGFIDLNISLQAFSLINCNKIIDRIKTEPVIYNWTEATRQGRASALISFTRFLSREFDGMIRRAEPKREGEGKTFFKIREKVKTKSLTMQEWQRFIPCIYNNRDRLMAKLALQGAKRINEVLSLTVDRINWTSNEITFIQSKTFGKVKHLVITFPVAIMDELRAYVGNRTGLVFVTRTGKKVEHRQLLDSFANASRLSCMPFKVTPHVLRTSAITYLKEKRCADSDICKMTGQHIAQMISYDKSDRSDNPSRYVNLV